CARFLDYDSWFAYW
nr:immunoglobulin heavy chain junction region [Mus musculus]